MAIHASRRTFLRTAPLAAAAGLSLAEVAQAQSTPSSDTYQLITADTLAADAHALQAKPGNNNLVDSKTLPFAVVLTTETAKSAKEFEWHEGRDHILQVIDGDTVYMLGGKPQNGRQTRPGEWLAPVSEGAQTMTLHKGDMLIIPRNTPHKRMTEGTVTFTLISPSGKL